MNVSLPSMLKRIVEINNTGVTGRILPHNLLTLSMHAFGPRISAYAFLTKTDIHTDIPTYTKYSTLLSGISAYIVPKVGIFPEAGGRGKYSLPRVQYMPIFHKEGF